MIVLDSSFLIGFHNERDMHHAAARRSMETFLRGEWGRGLLLEYVFVEVVTVLLLRRDHSVASRVGRILLEAQELEFVPCSDAFTEAWETFSRQPGTQLSFVDAAIATVARTRAEGLVLSFDEEFRKFEDLRVLPEITTGMG